MKGKARKDEQARHASADETKPVDTPEPVVQAAETPLPEETPEGDGGAAGQAAAPGAAATGPTVEQLMDRLLRLQADFDNYRKRTLREKSEVVQRANEEFALELLPVLDHLDLALEAASAHDAEDAIVKGFRIVAEQFFSVLARFGITPIKVEGGPFDHNLHEAISHIPSVDVAENGIIAQVRKGYRLGDRLLRAAQVVVSSGCAGPANEADVTNGAADGGDSSPSDS